MNCNVYLQHMLANQKLMTEDSELMNRIDVSWHHLYTDMMEPTAISMTFPSSYAYTIPIHRGTCLLNGTLNGSQEQNSLLSWIWIPKETIQLIPNQHIVMNQQVKF